MKLKLLALLIGVTMLGGAGIANAADVTKAAGTQSVILTDTQMNGITAGHLLLKPANNNKHYGWHWKKKWGVTYPGKGNHRGCGKISCPG